MFRYLIILVLTIFFFCDVYLDSFRSEGKNQKYNLKLPEVMIHYIFCLTFLLHISAALLLLINRCESVPTITPNSARENNRTSVTAAAVTPFLKPT